MSEAKTNTLGGPVTQSKKSMLSLSDMPVTGPTQKSSLSAADDTRAAKTRAADTSVMKGTQKTSDQIPSVPQDNEHKSNVAMSGESPTEMDACTAEGQAQGHPSSDTTSVCPLISPTLFSRPQLQTVTDCLQGNLQRQISGFGKKSSPGEPNASTSSGSKPVFMSGPPAKVFIIPGQNGNAMGQQSRDRSLKYIFVHESSEPGSRKIVARLIPAASMKGNASILSCVLAVNLFPYFKCRATAMLT